MYLALHRKKDQSIRIGDDIVITVLGRVRDGEIKLGITAPKSVKIIRVEIADERLIKQVDPLLPYYVKRPRFNRP